MNMGHLIAKYRIEKSLSQKQLSKILNVSPGLVGHWESNLRSPSMETFITLIDYFEINADELLIEDRKFIPKAKTITDPKFEKIIDTFSQLDEDNQDILIGEAKKLLKSQRLEEKRDNSTSLQKKAT